MLKHWKQMSMKVIESAFENNIPHQDFYYLTPNTGEVNSFEAILESIHFFILFQKLVHIFLITSLGLIGNANPLQRKPCHLYNKLSSHREGIPTNSDNSIWPGISECHRELGVMPQHAFHIRGKLAPLNDWTNFLILFPHLVVRGYS